VFRGAVGVDGDGEDGWLRLGVGGGEGAGDEREDEEGERGEDEGSYGEMRA
jgi:hypothetical protein